MGLLTQKQDHRDATKNPRTPMLMKFQSIYFVFAPVLELYTNVMNACVAFYKCSYTMILNGSNMSN